MTTVVPVIIITERRMWRHKILCVYRRRQKGPNNNGYSTKFKGSRSYADRPTRGATTEIEGENIAKGP